MTVSKPTQPDEPPVTPGRPPGRNRPFGPWSLRGRIVDDADMLATTSHTTHPDMRVRVMLGFLASALVLLTAGLLG